MSRIAVVTDSTANIPGDLARQYNIYVVPLQIIWDKVRYRDGIDIKPDAFYQRLRKSPTLPTTSGAIQGEFLQLFEGLRGKVDGIATILISTEFSAAYSSAMSAKEMTPDIPIEVIDTRLATMGMGFGVIAAARVASAGGNMEQVIKAAWDVLKKVRLFFALDTLDYLRRGGRVNFPSAILANLLKVKPILTIKDGKASPVDRPRTRRRAIERLLSLMKASVTDTPVHVAVMHADDIREAVNLKKEIASSFQCTELFVTGFTPVMGTHTGPGLIGVAFYNE